MIPKIIHYCWFGRNPLPPLALECIASWKKYLPDYEIKEWNEDNFDVNSIPYTAEAYKQKKYAFVSDYARFWILNKYGGIYFDTDVEVIRPMDDIIQHGPFMGYEIDPHNQIVGSVAPGLGMGCVSNMIILESLIECYKNTNFEFVPGTIGQITVVHITTQILKENGLTCDAGIQNVQGMYIYPSEYFCPINVVTNRIHIEKNTRTIHHYAGTWMDRSFTWNHRLKRIVPECMLLLYSRIKSKIKNR